MAAPTLPPHPRPRLAGTLALAFLATSLVPLALLVEAAANPCRDQADGHGCWGEGFAYLAFLLMAPFAILGVALATVALVRALRRTPVALSRGAWRLLSAATWTVVGLTGATLLVFLLPEAAAEPLLMILYPVLFVFGAVLPFIAVGGWGVSAGLLAVLAFRQPLPVAAAVHPPR